MSQVNRGGSNLLWPQNLEQERGPGEGQRKDSLCRLVAFCLQLSLSAILQWLTKVQFQATLVQLVNLGTSAGSRPVCFTKLHLDTIATQAH